jgi:guanylate kinase
MKRHLCSSIIITGASVTGKTTLCRRLMVHFGLQPLPAHMTREPRNGEIENVDAIFITEDQFKTRFINGDYLQESLESAYFSGAYYGCPKEWISRTENEDYRCFVCPTVKMAKELKELLGQKIFWIHLIANKDVRLERLAKRNPNIKKEDFNARISRGEAVVDTTGHDLIIDTSYLNAWEIFFHALARL